MSTKSELVNKQIQALAVNSKFLTSILTKNETENKHVVLKKHEEEAATCEKELYLNSMLELTSFILYNDFTSVSSNLKPSECLFKLNNEDLRELEYFATELDTIEADLVDININIKAYQNSYKIYCNNLLKLIDQKDLLTDMFLDYYEEYFLKPQTKHSNISKKTPKYNNKCIKESDKTKRSSSSSSDDSQNTMPLKLKRSRSTVIYVYSVPTENRFSVLAKSKQGTLIKHYS
jgi:hypothetical protein